MAHGLLDTKKVKPRREDQEGQEGPQEVPPLLSAEGPKAALSYLLHFWDLRCAGQRPRALHGQHVLQQCLTPCGWTDGQQRVRASAWHGSFAFD